MKESLHRNLVIVGFGFLVAVIVGVLGTAVLALPVNATGLAEEVDSQLDQAGAKNPVTAVLLNFRGYDTLLEVTVLLLAVLGARALVAAEPHDEIQRIDSRINPVLLGFIRVIAPVMIIVAGYLLWVGGHAPGGAFQAGAVLAALGVILKLGGVRWTQYVSDRNETLLLVAGLIVFLMVGVGTMWGKRQLLEYAPTAAKWLMLLIEVVATISIASILIALFRSGTFHESVQPHDANDGSAE